MPDKYHIKTSAIAGHFRRVGKYASVDYREDCSRCTNCVKPRCVYDTYRKENAYNRDAESSVQLLYECRACFSCVQGCTKGLLSLCVNPEYLAMGDDYWTPTVIDATWKQADTGRIPVSGAGYRGRFHGPGFDSIWTDMSEIVRPTRDGIHGREYISTSVDIGTKPMRLSFGANGELLGELANLVELPIPALLDMPQWDPASQHLAAARLAAATALKTFAIVPLGELDQIPESERPQQLAYAVPLITAMEAAGAESWLDRVRMVELVDGPLALVAATGLLAKRRNLIVAVRMPFGQANRRRISECVSAGIKVFHLCADLHGREVGGSNPRHIKDALRELHAELVTAGIRDQVTLIIGGGIALAEHMAKAVICGADLVALDTALLVALGCRVCRNAENETADNSTVHDCCPAEIRAADTKYAAQRIINLVGAWHSQLIEVLGAMGIREVRRLRGEVGRAIFREDIEREAFGDLVHKQQ